MMDKPAKKKVAADKRSARPAERFDVPNLELAALLLASGLLLFIGRALTEVLDATEAIAPQIYSGLGLGLFVLAAIGFSRTSFQSSLSCPFKPQPTGWRCRRLR